ncbi:MAG TPA: hypothetical protein DCQ68_01420 [Chryseobacterium indologenes]|nr:hypothetical protein [Chryseobacterium indologenes]
MSRTSQKASMLQFIDFELMLLRDYIEYVENYFSQKELEIQNNFAELHSISEDDPVRQQIEDHHKSYFEVMQDNLIDDNFYNSEFTQRFRYSLIIQIQSFYERYLSRIERHFNTKNAINKSLPGNYIEKIKAAIKQTDISVCKNYDFMVCFTELRNCIVHEEGVIYSDSKNTKRIEAFEKLKSAGLISLKETTGIKRTRYEVNIEGKNFLEDSVNKIEDFLGELDAILNLHY